VPSKLLLGFAEVATTIRDAARFHMEPQLNGVDVETIRSETQAARIKAVDGRIESKLSGTSTLFRSYGRFVGPKQIEVNRQVIEGEKVLVATGTRPTIPKQFENLPVWTSDDVFNMDEVPKSIVIIGGGYIA
jgi:mycothione reductase